MQTRKVLLLTYHFPPSGAVAVYRMLGLVRYLPKFGWQPVVVAPPQVPWEPHDPSLLALVPPDTPVERVPFAEGFLGKMMQHLAPEGHWVYKAWPACRRMIESHRPEAVITSSPPGYVHRLGLWVQSKYGLPWLACFRDPWITNAKIDKWTLQNRYDRWLEAKVMRRASRLIANTPLNRQGWAKAFPEQAHKIVTITNGFDPERFATAAPTTPPANGLTMVHTGELYYGRDPRPFLDALQQMDPQAAPACVEFVGRNTEQVYDLPAEIARRDIGDRVKVTGQIPYGEALAKMVNADILLLVQGTGLALGVPAKLYEYLGAGRPILALAAPDGDIAWVLRESRVLHRIAAPNDVPAIQRALIDLSKAIRGGAAAVPDRDALQQFTRERMAQRFAECLESVTQRTPTAIEKQPVPA
jgi:glycosyltransferase involved in cell wall biosynthesis